ncbi:unnamed protein product [Durusdinium trenchii]|uniref:EF-hand domain-containing protein n=2 Tax=Durusdinium trenchii TaxID=1381693 RepID=A0ABP0N4D5_9DINO
MEVETAEWALIFQRMVDGKQESKPKVLLPDFVRALALARPVENLYMLRLRCQKLFGSVSKAWSSLWASSEEVSLNKWQISMLKMSIAHFDAVRLFRLILTSPFHHALPPSTKSSHLQSSDELYISKSAFLAAMKGPNIDASNTILELLQQSQSQFPVSAAFEGHCFPRHPLGEAEFAEAVVPILQRCRAPSKIYPSAQTLLEEGQLLFNYLDVSAEGVVLMESLLEVMTAVQASYLFTEDVPRSNAGPSPFRPFSSVDRWKRGRGRRPGEDDPMRETVSTMIDSEDSATESMDNSRPTTMGSRGTRRAPQRPSTSGASAAIRPMTAAPFEVAALTPLQEAESSFTSIPSVSTRSTLAAVHFTKKLQSKAKARQTGRRSTTAPSAPGSSSDAPLFEGLPAANPPGQGSRTPKLPKLPALQEKQEGFEASTASAAFGTEPLVLGLKGRGSAPSARSAGGHGT